MKLHVITGVKLLSTGHLQVFFDDHSKPVIDLSPMLAQGGVFEPLRDPARFAAVEVGARGRTLVWRVDDEVIDLCADALWLMVHPADRAAMVALLPG